MDWTALGTIVAGVAAITAMVALMIQMKQFRTSLKVDVVLRLNDRFDSKEVREWRCRAATKLLQNQRPNYELEQFLDFLATIAKFYEQKIIDTAFIYDQYSWWISRYYLCAHDHILESRKLCPESFLTLERVAKQLIRLERHRGSTDEDFSAEKLRAFLTEETMCWWESDGVQTRPASEVEKRVDGRPLASAG